MQYTTDYPLGLTKYIWLDIIDYVGEDHLHRGLLGVCRALYTLINEYVWNHVKLTDNIYTCFKNGWIMSWYRLWMNDMDFEIDGMCWSDYIVHSDLEDVHVLLDLSKCISEGESKYIYKKVQKTMPGGVDSGGASILNYEVATYSLLNGHLDLLLYVDNVDKANTWHVGYRTYDALKHYVTEVYKKGHMHIIRAIADRRIHIMNLDKGNIVMYCLGLLAAHGIVHNICQLDVEYRGEYECGVIAAKNEMN